MKMGIKYMDKFGKDGIHSCISLNEVSSLEDLPGEMRVLYQDVNPEASMASFICYCTDKGISRKYIAARSGFSESEIMQIVKDAKNIGIYFQLCEEFLK